MSIGVPTNEFVWISSIRDLRSSSLSELDESGFTVIPGPVPARGLPRLSEAYDAAADKARPEDIYVGSTTTRIRDFANRGPEFDQLYVYGPLLQASCHTIGRPFRLSTIHARTVRPGSPAQKLHVDFEREDEGWPMVGFILMIDEFRKDNGATRFVRGSHLLSTVPPDHEAELVCASAGSLIIYNGSVWHGHSMNFSGGPRRSIQGAYIRREAPSGEDLRSRMLPETINRISPTAKYVLGI